MTEESISPENTPVRQDASNLFAGITPTPDDRNLVEKITDQIKTVYDPEISVNIYELGLIYEINVLEDNNIDIQMTLTSPACPAAGMLPGEVEEKVKLLPEVNEVKVEVVFDPPWDQSMMSDEARLELGFM